MDPALRRPLLSHGPGFHEGGAGAIGPGDIVFMPSLRLPRLIELGGSKRGIDAATQARATGRLFAHDRGTGLDPTTPPRTHHAGSFRFCDAGLHVSFELPKPIFRSHPFHCVDWFNRHNPALRGRPERALEPTRNGIEPPSPRSVRSADRANSAGVSAWDPLPALCDELLRPALRDGRPLFFDGDHVSPYGNLVLLPAFRAVVLELERRQPAFRSR